MQMRYASCKKMKQGANNLLMLKTELNCTLPFLSLSSIFKWFFLRTLSLLMKICSAYLNIYRYIAADYGLFVYSEEVTYLEYWRYIIKVIKILVNQITSFILHSTQYSFFIGSARSRADCVFFHIRRVTYHIRLVMLNDVTVFKKGGIKYRIEMFSPLIKLMMEKEWYFRNIDLLTLYHTVLGQ